MRRFWFGLSAAALLLLPQARATAWSYVGHLAVDKLAYDQMDDALKLRVGDLLKAHPHYKAFLSADRPEGVSEPEWAFLRAGYWPDWVRNRHPGVDPEPTQFNRPHDHYIDFPYIKPADKELFDEAKLQPDVTKDNVVAALERHAKVLSSDAKDADKAVSLCWLMHLVGDVHQPLHGAALFSKDYKQGDQGGNLIALAIDGKAWRLHWYWDSILDEDAPPAEAAGDQAKVYAQVKKVAERLRDPEYKREKFAEQLKGDKFVDWAKESFELAKKVVYLDGKLEGVVPEKYPRPLPEPDKLPRAPDDYGKKATEVARRRVALAGYRLADKLKGLLAKP
jgi:hypothetical protein